MPEALKKLKSPGKIPLYVSASIFTKMKEIVKKNGIVHETNE
jgi:hypothetical protein